MGKSWIDLVFQKSGKHLSSKILRCEKRYSADVRQTSGELLSKLWCNWRGDVFGFMHFLTAHNAEQNSRMRKNTYIILLKYVCIYIYTVYIYIFPYASGGNSVFSPGKMSSLRSHFVVEERSSQWRRSTVLLKSVEDPVKVEMVMGP